MNKNLKRNLYLVSFILVISIVIWFCFFLLKQHHPSMVEVSVDGKTVKTFSLYENTTYIIHGNPSGSNELIINNGEAWIKTATCPDKTCMHQGHIHETGQMIVCLPNKVIVKIVNK